MTDQFVSATKMEPPRELIEQWASEKCYDERDWLYEIHIANRAAAWGANQELEACCDWLHWQNLATHADLIPSLRAARRSKPSSLAEEALVEIQEMEGAMYSADLGCDFTATRRALERLQELENND